MFHLSHVFLLRAYCALHPYHSHMSNPCQFPNDVKLLLLLSPECTIEGRSHPLSCLLDKSKSHSSFCLFSFFFSPHARKTFTEHQSSPPSSRRKTSYFDHGPQWQRQATSPSHRRQSTYTHTLTDRLYNRAIEHCVPPPFGRRYASPASLEGSIWQQIVNLRLANKGCQLQYLPQLQQIRETWTETYGLTFGPELPPPPPPPTPAQRERERESPCWTATCPSTSPPGRPWTTCRPRSCAMQWPTSSPCWTERVLRAACRRCGGTTATLVGRSIGLYALRSRWLRR